MRSNSHSIGAIFGTDEDDFSQHKIIMTCSELPIQEGLLNNIADNQVNFIAIRQADGATKAFNITRL